MPTRGKSTLTQFLIEERRSAPSATGELNALITDISLACKAISRRVAHGALLDPRDPVPEEGAAPEEAPRLLQKLSHRMFLRANEWGGHVAGMMSSELEAPFTLPDRFPRGKYLLLFDALDGASNADVNVTMGSIFSILHAARPGEDAAAEDFLQAGTRQVGAGYAIYGPSTMLVLTLGNGTHAFTLDPMLGEWVLSHRQVCVPPRTREFAIDASNTRFWEPAVKRYVDECAAGQPGARGVDFNMRWIASLVAETHRILMRGGVFLHPCDGQDRGRVGSLRLLCDANPVAMLIEQAGGRASNGRRRLLEMQPEDLHQRVGFVFGSAEEVERIEAYHHEEVQDSYVSPLFGRRSLFANAS